MREEEAKQGKRETETASGANWSALNFSFGIDLHWNLITLRDCFYFVFWHAENRDKVFAKLLELA